MAHMTCKQCLIGNHTGCIFNKSCYCTQLGHPKDIIERLAKEI